MLVSEPMGTLLVNERMLESFVYARDHFLKPGGRMFPVRFVLFFLVDAPRPVPHTLDTFPPAVSPHKTKTTQKKRLGRIHAACFSDTALHAELAARAAFWAQRAFFGVDVTSLHGAALDGIFTQVVVDAFDPALLVSGAATHVIDFASVAEAELHDIRIPLRLAVGEFFLFFVFLFCWCCSPFNLP